MKFHSCFARSRLRSGVSLFVLFASCAPALAEEPVLPVLDEVIVTAPTMDEPMLIHTDPRNPRTPVPPADGAGYLKNIPGFNVVRQGGIDGDPLLRGQGGSRLNVLLDGTPLLGGCPNRMDPPTSYIFPDSFDRLTVLKGPQSVVHGGSALGTVLIDREAPRFDKLSVQGRASALYGSNDRNDEMLEAAIGDRPGFVRAVATHSSSRDYKDGNGDQVRSNYWRHSGSATLGWTPDRDTLLQFTVDKSQAQSARVGAMDGARFDREGLNLLLSKANISPLVAKVKAQVYHNYVDHIMDVYSLRNSVNNMNMGASQVDHLMEGAKASIELTPVNATKVTLGADFNSDIHTARSQTYTEYRNGTSLDSKNRVRDMSFETYSAFAEVAHELSAVNRLIGGYRYSQVHAERNNRYPNYEDTRNLNSAFGRYEHDLNAGLPMTVFGSLGHVERAPDFWERGKTTTTQSFDMGNETTEQLDIGTLFKSGPWKGSASLFYAYTDSYILVSSGGIKGVDARRYGGEGELAYKLAPSWSVEATIAYVRGDNLTESKPLAQTPPLDSSLAVKYDDGMFLGGLHLRAVAGQDRTDAGWGNIISQDLSSGGAGGFAVLSANAGWRINEAALLTAGIDNILDKTYTEHVSKTGTSAIADMAAYNDSVRVNEPGRTLWMRGSLKF